VRGTDETSGSLVSSVDLEDRIPARHPLRKIRQIVNDALASLDCDFDVLYSTEGRPSIAPEPEPEPEPGRRLRASLIQILFSVRSRRRHAFGTTRQLMEQMQYNLIFRWIAGLWHR
jgi:transposase